MYTLFRLCLIIKDLLKCIYLLYCLLVMLLFFFFFFFFQAEDGIRDVAVTGVQTCALPISAIRSGSVEAEQLEQRRQIAELLPGGRRGAADEVEDLAVLHAVIGESAEIGRAHV